MDLVLYYSRIAIYSRKTIRYKSLAVELSALLEEKE